MRSFPGQAGSQRCRFCPRVEPDDQTATRPSAWRRKTLARDTAFLVLGLCLVAALLTGLAAQQVLEAGLRNGLEAELNREFQRVEASFEIWRAQEAEDVAEIARDPELGRAIGRGSEGAEAVRERLRAKLETEPDALGLTLIRGRSMESEASVEVAEWLPERWTDVIDLRRVSLDKPTILRIDGTLVVLMLAPVGGGAERGTLVAAVNPRTAFTGLGRTSRARIAILDEAGELLAGAEAATEVAHSDGILPATDAEGVSFLALRRILQGTPWRVAIALPQASAPAGTVMSIVAASTLIALLASLVAFAIGERRMRPLDELAEGARRLAAGESGVRVKLQSVHGEVEMLARSFNDMAGQLEEQRRVLEDRNLELLRANEVLEQLSITDGLTHLHNHRHFHDQFAREVKRADRNSQPLCLMLIDIDDFKVLNDSYGHAAGDMVLAVAAQLMNSQVRESDYLARYGGEEFAMLLPQTPIDGAVALAEKIRGVLSEHAFSLPETGEQLRVTVSIGVAQHSASADDTFDSADRALYEAKGAGKDCVIVAQLVDQPTPSPRRRR